MQVRDPRFLPFYLYPARFEGPGNLTGPKSTNSKSQEK